MADTNAQTKQRGLQYMWSETREKWRRIARLQQRDIAVVLDNAADRELARLGIMPASVEITPNEQLPATGESTAGG